MKKFLGRFGRIVEPRSAISKGVLFILIPAVAFVLGKWIFEPVDSIGASILQPLLSLFSPVESLPKGLGFAFAIGALYILGVILKYEEETGKYALYRLHNLKVVGFLFPLPKSFQFESCAFWASPSDRRPAAYRGTTIAKDGTKFITVVDINGPPNIFGASHFPDPRYVVLLTMPTSKLISMAASGAMTSPTSDDLEAIPWDGETKEEATKRLYCYPG